MNALGMTRRYAAAGLCFFAAALVLGLVMAAIAPVAGIRAFATLGVIFAAAGALLHIYALGDAYSDVVASVRDRLEARSREAAGRVHAFSDGRAALRYSS